MILSFSSTAFAVPAETCRELFHPSEYHKVSKIHSLSNLKTLFSYLSAVHERIANQKLNLNPEDMAKLLDTTTYKVSNALAAKGIKHRFIKLYKKTDTQHLNYPKILGKDYLWVVQILPDPTTQIGRFATALKAQSNYRLIYDPILEVYLDWGAYLSSETRALAIPLYMLDKFKDDESILPHEFRHLLSFIAFHNEKSETLPLAKWAPLKNKKLKISEPTYEENLDFDEVFAYYESVRFELLFLRKSLRLKSKDSFSRLASFKINLAAALTVSIYFERELKKAFDKLELEGTKNLKVFIIRERYFNVFEIDGNYQLFLPAPLKELKPRALRQYHLDQIQEMQQINLHYLRIYKFIDKKLEGLDARHKKQLKIRLKKLQHVLQKWNLTRENNEPITYKEMNALYKAEADAP